MPQRSHVPKFGNWESEDNVPYTVYFDKVRKDRTRGGMINLNDPQENPDMFPNMPPPAHAPASPARREPAEPVVGQRAVRPTHERHSSKEDVGDLKRQSSQNQLAEVRNSHNTLSKIQNSSKNQDQFCRRFTFVEIRVATHNFSDEFLIGKGGFGKFYKGIIANGAIVVAIKRLDPMSKQGGKELSTEIEMLSKFRHRHIVSLIGYCDNKDEIILVYEYMGNGSLADHLYKEKSTYGSNSSMSWVQRVKICIGVAQGLDYLHTGTSVFHRVIHGNVKSSNILLDENWAAKISDFGVSVIVPEKHYYVSTHVEGTWCYCDPEYTLTGNLTEKSDVYSFGVVLLEVLSGRRAVDFTLHDELVQWGQRCIQEDKTHWFIDPDLEWEIQENSLKAFVKIAGQCLLSHSKERPTMSEVVASLEFALASHQKKDSSVLYEDYDCSETFDNRKADGSSTVQSASSNIIKPLPPNSPMSEVVASLEFALASHQKKDYVGVYDFGVTFDNRKAEGSSTVQSNIVSSSSTILKPLTPNSPIGQSQEIENTFFAEDTSSDESTVDFVDFDKYGLKGKDISMWWGTECHLMNSGLSKLPENMNLPVLRELLLQDNYDLSEIPPSFFKFMPALQVLDMSRTSIKYLPPSISNLIELQKLLLRGCKLLMELPAEIQALKNLEVFDLAGTELIYIPKEIEMLSKLEHLEVSLCSCADEYISEIKENGEIIPRKALSKLLNLKELSIFVDPDCEWWYAEVEAVIQDLFSLEKLETVKLYFPTVELLQKFLQLPRVEFQSLSNFRLIVGRHDQGIISHVPPDLQDRFEILEKCLKYVNGEGNIDGIGQVLKQARALFLDRHWTIDRLSTFKADEMDKLRFCLLVECNEMITVIDRGDNVDKSNAGKPILGLLQYLSIHYMKNLESISVGPLASGCLYNLQILALHTCPKLTTIFNVGLLSNLVNLKELIVEDCPKVESLVTVESSHLESDKKFLPSLEKISLLHLPGLVSISSGLCVAPRLQRIVVYNCPKLQSLSPMEIFSIGIEEIKGESEWWEALEWKSNQPDYLHRVFVPLRRDGLMNQLAEARNTHNTLSMIQNTSKNQQRSRVPKFGNWESEYNVPYTVYFDKARKDRTGEKMINPNDPQENPDMFPNMSPPAQAPAPAPAPAPPARRELAEPVVGRHAVRPTHKLHSSKEDVGDLKQYAGSPARGGATGAAQQRRGAHGSGSGRPVRSSAGSEHSIDRLPLHPHYQANVTGGRGSGSPAAEGKNSYESSHGTPGRSRMKPNRGDESPDKGAAVPRFGEWDENNPSSADNYTHIFNKVREARHNSGSPQISMENESSYNNGGRQRADGNRKTRCFGCFG